MQGKRNSEGIRVRHSRFCPSMDGGTCNAGRKDGCVPSYEASVYDRRSNAKLRKTFSTLAAAKAWRADATSQLNRGTLMAPTKQTLRDAAEAWIDGATAEPPTIRNREGERYKPSVLRGYEADLRLYVLPALGDLRLSEIRRGDVQALVDRLVGAGLSASKVRNAIMPLRVIYRHALKRDVVNSNPTTHLELPAPADPRERAASASEAAELLAALDESDRALWATAFYGGLRRGELMGIRWSDVDLAKGVLTVNRAWDAVAGAIEPKSENGTRTVPIAALLRDYLIEHKARSGRDGDELVFGATAERPFTPSHVRKRALGAWAATAVGAFLTGRSLARPLVPIGLHEGRHTYVSLMFDAGLSLERIGKYVGHGSAYMTSRYMHLLEGHEQETARVFDAYLARSDTAGRIEQLDVVVSDRDDE